MGCTKCNCENLDEQLRTHIIALSQIWKYTKDVSASSSIAALRNNILLKHFRLHHHHQRFLTQLQHRQRHHFQSNSHSHPMNRCHVCSHRYRYRKLSQTFLSGVNECIKMQFLHIMICCVSFLGQHVYLKGIHNRQDT